MDPLERCIKYFLQSVFVIFVIIPAGQTPLVLNVLYRIAWLIFLLYYSYLPVMFLITGGDNSLVRWVRLFLSVGSAIIYMFCIVESTLKWRKYGRIGQKLRGIDDLIKRKFKVNLVQRRRFSYLKSRILPLLIILIVCEIIKLFTLKRLNFSYWFTLTIVTGLRLRYFHIIVILCDFNERLCLLCEALKRLKAYNGSGPNLECAAWRRNNHWEFAQLNMLRLIHGRIYELLQIINEHVGWSMTLIAQETLFEFVCYTYWCLTYKLVKMGMGAVIFNFVTIFSLGCLHYQWFRQAERVKQNGEKIAAITTQLYKPIDDKRYNDLLLVFLIQTMHQKFMVTTKGFHIIDLKNLATTIHVFANYLVFLLQFTYTSPRR